MVLPRHTLIVTSAALHRYVVMYATRVGGVIISQDKYRDVSCERPDWRDTIENRSAGHPLSHETGV